MRTAIEENTKATEKRVEKAEKEKEEAENTAASVRSGKLIQYGITAGIGPVMHVPLHGGNGRGTPAAGVMPYIMLHPMYWQNRPQQNRYCANIWAGKQSHAAASKAADGEARERAERRAESLYAAIRTDPELEIGDLASSAPRNNREARIYDLLHDIRIVAGIPADPEIRHSVSCMKRRGFEQTRDLGASKPTEALDKFDELAKCPKPGEAASKLRGALCNSGRASKDLDQMLAIAGETILVEDLEKEVDSRRRRRQVSEKLERLVDELFNFAPSGLESLDAKTRSAEYSLFTTASSGRIDLAGVTEADLQSAKRIVQAQDLGQTAIDLTTTVDGKQETAKVDVAVLHKALVSELQVHTVKWMSDIPGSCNSRRFFGVWLGYPLKFKTTVPIQSGTGAITRRQLEVTEIIAGGLGFSPNAYISVLMGFSVGLTNLPPGDNDSEVVATFVLGLGGNLDILTLLRE